MTLRRAAKGIGHVLVKAMAGQIWKGSRVHIGTYIVFPHIICCGACELKAEYNMCSPQNPLRVAWFYRSSGMKSLQGNLRHQRMHTSCTYLGCRYGALVP